MNLDSSVHDLETGLKDLFRHAYFTNAKIEKEEVKSEDKETLEDLEPLEVVENLKELVKDLLEEKEKAVNSDKDQLLNAN